MLVGGSNEPKDLTISYARSLMTRCVLKTLMLLVNICHPVLTSIYAGLCIDSSVLTEPQETFQINTMQCYPPSLNRFNPKDNTLHIYNFHS